MVVDPLFQSMAAVYARLSTDPTLLALLPGGVWSGRAPVDIDKYPLLTFNMSPTRTDYTFSGPYRHALDMRLSVIDKGEDDLAVISAGARAYVLLQDAPDSALPMADYDVLYCRRQTTTQTAPVREGDQFQQVIHQYRLEVRPA